MSNDMPKNKPIPHNRPTLGEVEEKMAIDVIRSGWLAQGSAVEKFENELCNFLGLPSGSAVAVSSGTAALYLTLVTLDAIDKNVAMPFYCCNALRNATTVAGGKSVLVDSRIDSPNINTYAIDPSMDIAIIPHLFGIPQKIKKSTIKSYLIEDCAQSLGARVDEVPVGLQGHVSIFSFYATKLITSGGQGGMIVCKDQSFIKELKDYRTFNEKSNDKNRFNLQMTDLQAAIGRAQLHQFPQFIKRREEIYEQYEDANFPLLEVDTGMQPVRYRAILQTTKQAELIAALVKDNISASMPVKEWELTESTEQFPNASYWLYNTVSLPIYPSLSNNEVKRIIKIVKETL
jgi:perosamine synthetase